MGEGFVDYIEESTGNKRAFDWDNLPGKGWVKAGENRDEHSDGNTSKKTSSKKTARRSSSDHQSDSTTTEGSE